MSDHDEFPGFSGSGDPQEEALWEAYQAMLRRRKEPRARWSASDGPPAGPPEPKTGAPTRPNGARRIAARSRETQAAEPGPLVFQQIDSLDVDAGVERSRPGGGRGAALGAAVVLAGGAVLAVALWPRGSAPISRPEPGPMPGVMVGARPNDLPAQRPNLPCFVDGQLVGQLTLDDCATRNGVAGGPLQIDPGPGQAPRRLPPSAPIVPQAPGPAASSSIPTQVGPSPAAEPRGPASSRFVARKPRLKSLSPPRLQPRSTAPRAQDYAYAPPPARAPRLAMGKPPSMKLQPGEGYDRAPMGQVSPSKASAQAVREFYGALRAGDGERAASLVVPENREAGPLSAGELTRFYGSLQTPLRITKIDPIDDDTVLVRYHFVTPDNHICVGSATVTTTRRHGDTLVQGIHAFNGC